MNILVPVDFTGSAFNAYQYANKLAYQFGGKLTLLHVFEGTFDVADALEEEGLGKYEQLKEKLESFSHHHPNENSSQLSPLDTTCEIAQGNVVKEVSRFSSESGIDLIVAGTRDKHTIEDKWLGTISQGIAQEAFCPVLLVPSASAFGGFKRIVIATDYHASNFFVLDSIQSFNKPFGASLHFVHVQDDQDKDFEYLKREIFDYLMSYGEPSHAFEIEELTGDNVAESIFDYAQKENADLLIMISQRRAFLQKLIHRSMTREVVLQSPIPVLVIHADDKKMTK
ncbi:MAG: universal stress protein [Saprospiraceae bacterium]|nr:universal stress protein [Saprospiraceae bacterium]